MLPGGQIAAQTPSAELTTDGNTLVVTATGDLTTYNITSTSTATVFTAAGATVIKKGHVATNPNWVDAVNAGDLYDPSQLYFWYDASSYSNKLIEDNATYFSTEPGSTYIETKEVTTTKPFVEEVEAQAKAMGCTAVKFVQGDGEPMVLSADQMASLIKYSANSKTNYFSALDFSPVTGITLSALKTSYGTGTWDLNASFVLPNTIKKDDGTVMTSAEKLTWASTVNNGGNIYWYTPKKNIDFTEDATQPYYNLEVRVIRDAQEYLEAGAAFVKKDVTKNLLVHTTSSILSKLIYLDYDGISNLVLDGTTESVNNSSFGKDSNGNDVKFAHIQRLILRNSTWVNFPITAHGSLNVLEGLEANKPASGESTLHITNLNGEGSLAKTAEYYDDALDKAHYCNIHGTVGDQDVEDFLNFVSNPCLNLLECNWVGTTGKLKSLKNNYIKYLVLPSGSAKKSTYKDTSNNDANMGSNVDEAKGIAATSYKNFSFSGCKNLLGVGAYRTVEDPKDKTKLRGLFEAHSTSAELDTDMPYLINGTRDHDFSHVEMLNYMIRNFSSNITGDANKWPDNKEGNLPVDSILFSGYLNKQDINGSFGTLNINIAGANLKNAYFPTASDMTISGSDQATTTTGATYYGAGANWKTYLKYIDLPVAKEQSVLPHYCLYNVKSLKAICVPGNYTRLEEGAQGYNNQLVSVYTTAIDANGDGRGDTIKYGNYNNADGKAVPGQYSCTLPPHLEYVGTNCFALDEQFLDVYILNGKDDKIPECARDAFSAGTYYGWGGYNSTHPIQRNSCAQLKYDEASNLHISYPRQKASNR